MLFISLFIIPVLRFVLTYKLICVHIYKAILNCRLVVRAAVQNAPHFYDGLVLFMGVVLLLATLPKQCGYTSQKRGKR